MSNYTAIELGISEERQKLLNERAISLMITHPDLSEFLLALDNQPDLSSLEKIAISCTVTLFLVRQSKEQGTFSGQKVPLTSHS